ncbi:MAG: hypothetical protein WAK90_19085 [Pseudolabrys sp.]
MIIPFPKAASSKAPDVPWTLTPENLNALPEPLRNYIWDLRTNAAETLRENWQLRQEIVMLRRNLVSIAATRKSAELYDLFFFE